MAKPRADAQTTKSELLGALTQEQLAQITDLTRRLALAEAQRDANADPHLMRAGMDALERRLHDERAISLGREATLAAQILADGAALQASRDESDAQLVSADLQRQAAEREAAEHAQRAAQLEQELQAARAEAQSLQAEIDRIHASRSWKLTEPLRTGRRLLGGS